MSIYKSEVFSNSEKCVKELRHITQKVTYRLDGLPKEALSDLKTFERNQTLIVRRKIKKKSIKS